MSSPCEIAYDLLRFPSLYFFYLNCKGENKKANGKTSAEEFSWKVTDRDEHWTDYPGLPVMETNAALSAEIAPITKPWPTLRLPSPLTPVCFPAQNCLFSIFPLNRSFLLLLASDALHVT